MCDYFVNIYNNIYFHFILLSLSLKEKADTCITQTCTWNVYIETFSVMDCYGMSWVGADVNQ